MRDRERTGRLRDRERQTHIVRHRETENRGRLTAKRGEKKKAICRMKRRESRKKGQN